MVRRLGLPLVDALTLKIGVPVNPNRCYFLKTLVIAVCMSPNWERWHSSKMMTMCPSQIECPWLRAMKFDRFWIVMLIRPLLLLAQRSSPRLCLSAVSADPQLSTGSRSG